MRKLSVALSLCNGISGRDSAWFLIAALSCALANGAWAQSASQITPHAFGPSLEATGSGFTIPANPGLDAPPGAEKLFVRPANVSIVGGLPALAEAASAVAATLSGKRVSGAELFAAARALETAYARAGYVLVRVVLPPQTVMDGAQLKLVVVDGFIERIDAKGVPDRARDRVAAIVGPLVGRRAMTLGEIERRLLLAGDTPGLVLRSTLAQGKEPGGTVLVLEAIDQAVNGTVSVDNSLARSLGRITLGVGLDLNSVAGLGELTYFRANGYPGGGPGPFFADDPRNRQLAAGIILPLGFDGLSFNLEGTDARTAPLPAGGLRSDDVFDRISARLRYAWIRSRDVNLNTELSFDAQDETQSVLLGGTGTPLSIDRLRIVRLGEDADLLTAWGASLSGRGVASFGVDAFGARSAADATAIVPLSRLDADATFQKIEVSVGYTQSFLDGQIAATVTAHGQTAFGQALLRSEQIGIAGPGGLSSFDAGTLQGDSGYVVRGELSAPVVLPLPSLGGVGVVAAPYVFGAAGELLLNHPTALETPLLKAAAYGIGLHLNGAQVGSVSNGSLTLEYGREARSDAVAEGDRFSLTAAVRF